MASILKTQTGTWRAFVHYKGVKKSQTFKTKAAATAWGRQQELTIDSGVVAPAPAPEDHLMADVLDRYLREVTPLKRGIQPETSRMALLKARFGALTLKEMTKEVLLAWLIERKGQVSGDTFRRDMDLLSAVLEMATVGWEYPGSNPIPVVRKLVKLNHLLSAKIVRVRRLEPGEYKKLLRGLRETPVMRDIVRLIIESGLRRKEVAAITRVELRHDGLFITDDKTETLGTIPFSKRARRILLRYPYGFGLRPDSMTQAFGRACAREGIKDLRLHDLRREATSRYFELGLSVPEVQSITRHKDLRSLSVYTQPRPGDVSKKLD